MIFIMDAPRKVSPWFMFWNRLVIECLRSLSKGLGVPAWRHGSKIEQHDTHTLPDYLFYNKVRGDSIISYNLVLDRTRTHCHYVLGAQGSSPAALELACDYGDGDAVKLLPDWG